MDLTHSAYNYLVSRTDIIKTIVREMASLLIAVIFLTAVYLKFTAAPESILVFDQIGLEPVGRIFTGMIELLAVILILFQRTKIWGAILTAFLMIGVLFFHLTTLGIEVQGDMGLLFGIACLTLSAATTIITINANVIPITKYSIPSLNALNIKQTLLSKNKYHE